MGVTARMKILMVVLFLTIDFLSQSWGKHLLVETDDANNDDDIDGLYTNTVDAQTLIYTLSTKKQKKIIKDINKIIKNIGNRRKDMDFNMGVMEHIQEIVGGDKRVTDGLKSLIKLMPDGGKDYN